MRRVVDVILPVSALVLLAVGAYLGLVAAPTEQHMGDVYRILFVHVPSAWVAMVAFTVTFVASIVYLFAGNQKADALAEASAEIGVLFALLLLVTGSIWGRPTWGVWWTWDPRLTTAAIMLFAFLGYLALRRFVDVPEKRATWSAVVGIIVYVDIPIVWFSVKWFNTLHQLQSTKQTLGPEVRSTLWVGVAAFLVVYLFFLRLRYQVARMQQEEQTDEPPELSDGETAGVAALVENGR